MQRLFPVLITLGIIVWVFLLWQRTQPIERVEDIAERIDDANTDDRCAKYRMHNYEDESTWSLGYSGRLKQLAHGCF